MLECCAGQGLWEWGRGEVAGGTLCIQITAFLNDAELWKMLVRLVSPPKRQGLG